ncbi:MAG: DoxX family membrane protein [Planctomycetaceae bacterium]|nr:DoxX family membrane protein [Planctomycetaceae bacterium]
MSNKLAYHLTRMSLAFVYLYFGVLKFFDGCSPAESLAGQTIHLMTLKIVSAEFALIVLAVFETALGLLLLTDWFPRTAFVMFLIHMVGTFSPLILMPDVTFNGSPLMPTLVGQYIVKNVVYVAAVTAVYAPVLFGKKESRVGWSSRANRDFSLAVRN